MYRRPPAIALRGKHVELLPAADSMADQLNRFKNPSNNTDPLTVPPQCPFKTLTSLFCSKSATPAQDQTHKILYLIVPIANPTQTLGVMGLDRFDQDRGSIMIQIKIKQYSTSQQQSDYQKLIMQSYYLIFKYLLEEVGLEKVSWTCNLADRNLVDRSTRMGARLEAMMGKLSGSKSEYMFSFSRTSWNSRAGQFKKEEDERRGMWYGQKELWTSVMLVCPKL